MAKKLFLIFLFLILSIPAFASRQVFVAGTNSSMVNSSTNYINLMSGSSTSFSTTESNESGIVAASGNIYGLRIEIPTAPGSGASWQFTVYKNGASTAITCTISGTSSKNCADVSNVIAVNPGDTLSMEVIPSSTPTAARCTWTIIFDSDERGASVYLTNDNNNLSASATRNSPMAGESNWQVASTSRTLFPMAGIVKRLYVKLSAAPQNGASSQSYAFTILKRTAGATASTSVTCTITEDETSCSDLSNTFTVQPGDSISLQSVPANTPTAATTKYGFEFLASTDGQFAVNFEDGTSLTATTYLGTYSTSTNATEANRIALADYMQFKAIYYESTAAPGVGKSWAVTLREESSTNTALTCTISGGAATTCNLTGINVNATQDYNYDVSLVASGSPSATSAYGALLGYVLPRKVIVVN